LNAECFAIGYFFVNSQLEDVGIKWNNPKQLNEMKFVYKTEGTCSRSIEIEMENGIVKHVAFEGGCHGNTQGVCALVKGMKVEDVIDRLGGILCKTKPTSCPDQLARALRSISD